MHRLCTPLLIAALTALAALPASAAPDVERDDIASCAIDDLYPTCPALVGPQALRAQNEAWREDHIAEQSLAPGAYAMTFRGVTPELGTETKLAGLTVVDVLPAGCSGERVAIVRLEAPLAERCGANEIALRIDDHIGRHARVVAVRPEGLLTMVGGTLHFVRADDFGRPAPALDVSYASSFEIMAQAPARAPAPTAKKSKRKRKARRRG